MDVASLVAETQTWPPGAVYAALFGGALIEYVVPPFPGDTVVVGGAGLVGANGWPVLPVWLAVTAGSVVGSAMDLAVGRWLAAGRLDRLSPKARAAVDDLVGQFRRYGAVYLALNRFLPGIRALFFVAAGLAGLRTFPVLAWSAASAMVWNAALVGLGIALGHNVEQLSRVIERYQVVAWIFVAAIVVLAAVRVYRATRGTGRAD